MIEYKLFKLDPLSVLLTGVNKFLESYWMIWDESKSYCIITAYNFCINIFTELNVRFIKSEFYSSSIVYFIDLICEQLVITSQTSECMIWVKVILIVCYSGVTVKRSLSFNN